MDYRSKELIDIISTKTGLHFKETDISKIGIVVNERIRKLKFSSDHEYLRLLNSYSIEAKEEWKQLIPHLTTGESFFFRDKGQISILNKKIFPDLIEKKRIQKELRIWSAGCSSGEEPYTLAIMLDQLIPYWGDWKIDILATDMTDAAINKAKTGLYSDWSFRDVDLDVKNKYFDKKRNGNWEITERIKKKVTFKLGNLIMDNFPSVTSNIHSMDLIVCRNVFIYHKRESVFDVVQKFSKTLVGGGYLLVGHSELYGQNFDRLKVVSHRDSIYYQKLESNDENNGTGLNKIVLQSFSSSKAKQATSKANYLNKKTTKGINSQISGLNKTELSKRLAKRLNLIKRTIKTSMQSF